MRRHEPAGRFRPAQHADDLDGAVAHPDRAQRGIRERVRHVAAVDHDHAAVGQPRRREGEIARPLDVIAQRRAAGVNAPLLALQELGAQGDAAELVLGLDRGSASACAAADRPAAPRDAGRACRSAPSFQALRSSCQVPSPMKHEKAASANRLDDSKARAPRRCARGAHGASLPARRPSAALW